MDVLQNMMLFSELVQCGGNVYTWCYDAKGKLLRSNCPDEAFLASAFELFGCKQRMLECQQQCSTGGAAGKLCHPTRPV